MPRRKILVILFAFLLTAAVGAATLFSWQRTTNVGATSGQPDGIQPGGDRENSYAWCMETHNVQGNDYVYVGSNRDLVALALSGSGLTKEQIHTIFGDDVFLDPTDLRARIFRYKADGSQPWDLVYTSPAIEMPSRQDVPASGAEAVLAQQVIPGAIPQDLGYRGAQAYNGDLYMVSFGSLWGHTRVLQIRADGSGPFEVMRIGAGGIANSLRPITVHDEKLFVKTSNNEIFFSTAPQVQPPGVSTSTQGWTQVASIEDFGEGEPGAIGGLWEFKSFNGELYVVMGKPTNPDDEANNGFMLFRGRPAPIDAKARNQFGWEWECVIGPDGQYPRGLGKGANAAVSLGVFNNHLYMGTFQDFAGLAASGEFEYLVSHLNPCQIYRMDTQDRIEMVIGDSNDLFPQRTGNYGGGFFNISTQQALAPPPLNTTNLSMNQYLWWMAVQDGQLYVTTFDIRSFLKYITPETLAAFGMTPEQIEEVMQRLGILEQYNDNPAGFDLYATRDGVNFVPVTRDGFGDSFNYGGRTLLSSPQGLMVGTANPFWGAQVWRLHARVIPDVPTGGGSSSSSCFVATAAFGSAMADQVDTLRAFRDQYLETNTPGRSFVTWYYTNGPAAARWLEAHPGFKPAARVALYPAVAASWLAVNGMLVPSAGVLALLGLWALVRRRRMVR